MNAVFCSLEWKKDKAIWVEKDVNDKKPKGFIREVKRRQNRKVAYLLPAKSRYILTVKTESGKVCEEDIYGVIKYYAPEIRITKDFRVKFEQFMSCQEFGFDEKTGITGVYATVSKYFNIQ